MIEITSVCFAQDTKPSRRSFLIGATAVGSSLIVGFAAHAEGAPDSENGTRARSMSWGFEIGRIYNRRDDLHARFDGQRQGGIITPRDHPLVIIITGEEGLQHGYVDRRRADGVFEYFGEGQRGDMQLAGGNKAIAEHSAAGESLLLFRKTDSGLRFEGEMVCETFHYERSVDREGNDRSAIVFELRPLEAIEEIVAGRGAPPNTDLATLRAKALEAANASPRVGTASIRTVYERSTAPTFAIMCWLGQATHVKAVSQRRRSFARMAAHTWSRTIYGV